MLVIIGLVLYGPSYIIWYNLPKPNKSKWRTHKKHRLNWLCTHDTTD